MAYALTLADGRVQLRLHVQPRAVRSRLLGLHDGCLKVAVASPPVDGRANLAVCRFLADLLGVAPRDVVLDSGTQARKKRVVVANIDEPTLRARLAAALPPTGGEKR